MNRLILTNINELVSCRGDAPKRGEAMNDVGIIRDGSVVIEGDRISAVGSSKDIFAQYDINEYNRQNLYRVSLLWIPKDHA